MSNIQSRSFAVLIILLIFIGVVTRLEPLQDEQRMLKSISEDGYLMMTIARNMAIGEGMSTADGTIPTNGTQPLTSFLWAGAYWLEGGDKVKSIVWIILMQFLFATGAAFLLWRLGIQILQHRPNSHQIATLAAATWYASPVVAGHTMNGLETGLYGLAVLWIAIILVGAKAKHWSLRYSVLLGLLLGVTFWIRNDAAFLILAVCLMYLFMGGSWQRSEIFQRFVQVNVMGITTVLVALPWLIYNHMNFGNIMPISGQSQSLTASFGQNLLALPSVLVEYFLVFLPIPNSIQNKLPVILVCLVFLVGIVVMLSRLWSQLQKTEERRLFVLVSLYLLGFIGFYGLYFGASHFIARYFFPLSPFLALLWAAVVVWAWQRVPWQQVCYGFAALFIMVIIGLSVRSYLKGNQHGHFQVVEWVQQHVAKDVWVGAIQTGTLGYFHDRTINLDGKVNPEALEARKKNGVIRYVIEGKINYLADWVGIAGWLNTDDPAITQKQRENRRLLKQHFEVIVKDSRRNLAVLKRRAD
jgi:hypothetical protein